MDAYTSCKIQSRTLPKGIFFLPKEYRRIKRGVHFWCTNIISFVYKKKGKKNVSTYIFRSIEPYSYHTFTNNLAPNGILFGGKSIRKSVIRIILKRFLHALNVCTEWTVNGRSNAISTQSINNLFHFEQKSCDIQIGFFLQ